MPDQSDALPPVAQRARQVFDRVQHTIIEPMPAQWAVVRRVVHDAAVEVVVSEALFLGGSAYSFAPRSVRPAVLIVGCFPPWVPDPALPPYGLGEAPSEDSASRLRSIAFELIATPAYASLSRLFNSEVERTFGIRARGDIREPRAATDAWLQLTVERFEYPRTTLPPNFRFIGPLRPPVPDPVPDWWDPVAEPPVIAVRADGRTAMKDLVLPTIRAFGDTENTVVIAGVTRAEVAAAETGPIPGNVHFEERMPWPRLIPERSVVITDGDYLHTQHALRSGIPVVVSGTLETDAETGARVQWSGAGINLRRRRIDPDTLIGAVAEIRGDTAYREAAARLAADIAGSDAEGTICDLVEEHAAR